MRRAIQSIFKLFLKGASTLRVPRLANLSVYVLDHCACHKSASKRTARDSIRRERDVQLSKDYFVADLNYF